MNKISDDILCKVEKPSRYVGGELNQVIKDPKDVDIRFAFCFPDVYEVGMSHLGTRILYHTINLREDTYCERTFAPWPDMEELMRKNNIPLYTLETKDSLDKFDILGFTLQYEMSYTNILNMLDMSGIPFRASERGEDDPIIMAGGPCAYNPEPLCDIVDFFEIGEGEEMMNDVLDVYKKYKGKGKKKEFLREISKIRGIYVPSLYDVSYNEDGTIKEFKPKYEDVPAKVQKRIVNDYDKVDFPVDMIVPYTEIVHDRVVLETFRGCTNGCRFCQAGMIYRPVREKKRDKLIKRNPAYGEIVCRCEEISKGEILDAVRSAVPVFTLDAIKRRVRPGMGRCQGGFCGPAVQKILAEEKGCPIEEITKGNDYSVILFDKTKKGAKENV